MRAKKLTEILSLTIPAHRPVLIKGPPGVGKSDIVAQATDKAGAELVLTHPVVSDPTDFKGLPALVTSKSGKQQAEFLAYGDLRKLVEAVKPTVCFLDDLGQAPAVVQAAAMQLILARRVNGHKVSDEVTFIAATNRREDKAGVTGILEPVKSRFAAILELEANVEDWTEWALNNDVPAEVVAFIRFRPELLMAQGQPTNDIINRPCPRTITNLGHLLALGIKDAETLAGATGPGFAAEFVGFLRVYESLPSIDGVLMDPMRAAVPKDTAALYAISTALASRTSNENAGRVLKYLNRLPEEFSTLGVRDSIRTCPAAQNTRDYIQWASDHQGVLV